MEKVYVFLADGFEDSEAIVVIDLLKRAGLEVVTVSIKEDLEVLSARGIRMFADKIIKDISIDDAKMIFLPGGGVGTENLRNSKALGEMIKSFNEKGGLISAICAAPTILGGLGLLEGKEATSYPTTMDGLKGAKVSFMPVVIDGNIITSQGVGTVIDFALTLIAVIFDDEMANKIAKEIVYDTQKEH